MSIGEKLRRSESDEDVDFRTYPPLDKGDRLVKAESTEKMLVLPNWTTDVDFEGKLYAEYVSEHPGYDGIYVRHELLKRLIRASDSLASSYRLVLRAGHRPIAVQKKLLEACAADFRKNHLGTSQREAMDHARIFVSDPDRTFPPHVCGAAVDVAVTDATSGIMLDFGSTMGDDDERSYLYYPELSVEQKTNRRMLVTAMLGAGFASCKTEWWHYSYGDQLWAWFYGESNALYGLIDPVF